MSCSCFNPVFSLSMFPHEQVVWLWIFMCFAQDLTRCLVPEEHGKWKGNALDLAGMFSWSPPPPAPSAENVISLKQLMTGATIWLSTTIARFCLAEATPGDEQEAWMELPCEESQIQLVFEKSNSLKYPSMACYYIRFSLLPCCSCLQQENFKKANRGVYPRINSPAVPLLHLALLLTTWPSRAAGMTHLCTGTFLNDLFSGVCFCKRRRKDKHLSLIPLHLPTLHHAFTFFETAKTQWLKPPGFWMPS